jgi:hypothetical protein
MGGVEVAGVVGEVRVGADGMGEVVDGEGVGVWVGQPVVDELPASAAGFTAAPDLEPEPLPEWTGGVASTVLHGSALVGLRAGGAVEVQCKHAGVSSVILGPELGAG